MEETDVIQVPVIEEVDVPEKQEGPVKVGELHIRLYDTGGIELYVPEDSKTFEPSEIENLTDIVHKQLYEQRIAQKALDLFKQRLGN